MFFKNMWHSNSIHIICIDVYITCRYNTLVYFIAQQNVCKSPVTCLGLKGIQNQSTNKVRARGKGVSKNRSFRGYVLKGQSHDSLYYFLYGIQRKVSRAECTKAWESKPSKDHQCLYWLSSTVKVLIKNAKVSYFYNSQKKKTNHERVSC